MDNEILRVSSKERALDDEVNVSSYGGVKKKKEQVKENSFYNFLTEELAENTADAQIGAVTVEKPKLFEPVALAVLLLISNLVLSLVCFFTKEMILVPVLILISGVAVSISITYFCYRLNTHNDVSFLNIVKYALIGSALAVIYHLIDKFLSATVIGSAILTDVIKSLAEIILIGVAVTVCIINHKRSNYMSALLIASSVAMGYVIADTVTNLYYSLFVSIDVNTEGVTKSLGAIISTGNFVETSISNLIYNVFRLSIFKPTVFVFMIILCGFGVKFISLKNQVNTIDGVTGGLLFPLAVALYGLSEFFSSFSALQIVYDIIAVLFAVIVFYKVVDYCIKTETYKQ